MSRRAATWLAWSLAVLSLIMAAASVALYIASGSMQPPGNWGTGGASGVLIFVLPFLAFPPVGALIATVVMTVLVVIFSEILPKTIAIARADDVARTLSIPIFSSWARSGASTSRTTEARAG